MKRYQVMIDDAVSSQSFSLDELLEAGLLDDYDENIKVRAINETTWQVALEYPFHLSEVDTDNNDYIVNDDGTVTRKKNNSGGSGSTTPVAPRGYRIDEYGQVVRTGNNSNSSRLDLSTDSLSFTSSSGSRTISVTTNSEWSISLDGASWVHLSQSGDTLTVRVDQNYSSEHRTDYFKLKSGNKEKKVDIYQSGSSSSTSSSTSSSSEDNDGCSWISWVVVIIVIRVIVALFN